jgi:hypothetical protein
MAWILMYKISDIKFQVFGPGRTGAQEGGTRHGNGTVEAVWGNEDISQGNGQVVGQFL